MMPQPEEISLEGMDSNLSDIKDLLEVIARTNLVRLHHEVASKQSSQMFKSIYYESIETIKEDSCVLD